MVVGRKLRKQFATPWYAIRSHEPTRGTESKKLPLRRFEPLRKPLKGEEDMKLDSGVEDTKRENPSRTEESPC